MKIHETHCHLVSSSSSSSTGKSDACKKPVPFLTYLMQLSSSAAQSQSNQIQEAHKTLPRACKITNDSAKKGTVPLGSPCPGASPMQEWCYIIQLKFEKRFTGLYYNITFDMEAHCAWGASNLTPLASWASWHTSSLICASRCTQLDWTTQSLEYVQNCSNIFTD